MNDRRLAALALLAFTAGLWPAGALAGSYRPPRSSSTFNSSGFKANSTPRTGTSANPMAPGGKLTKNFKAANSRTTVGNNTGVRTNVTSGQTGKGGKGANGPGENQVKKPSGLIAESKPPSQTRSNRKP